MLMKMISYAIHCFPTIFMACILLKIYNIITFFMHLDMTRPIDIAFRSIFKNLHIFGIPMYSEYMLCQNFKIE